jgi:hypothetical protein
MRISGNAGDDADILHNHPVQDAVMAAEAGLAGVVLSNHGYVDDNVYPFSLHLLTHASSNSGRQLDFARSGLEVLVEVVRELKARKLWNPAKFEVYIDGGVRRATDVLKAIALGAKAVGIGRPLIFAYSAYGEPGVSHAFQILKVRRPASQASHHALVPDLPLLPTQDEFEMNMRLLGARTIDEVTEDMVDARAVGSHDGSVPTDHMFSTNCACTPSWPRYPYRRGADQSTFVCAPQTSGSRPSRSRPSSRPGGCNVRLGRGDLLYLRCRSASGGQFVRGSNPGTAWRSLGLRLAGQGAVEQRDGLELAAHPLLFDLDRLAFIGKRGALG